MSKILIIEDEKLLVDALAQELKDAGFEVEVALDGEVALGVLKTTQPDLILLDLILPKIDGFEVLARLRSDPALHEIPVIVLSNLGQDEDIKRAFELGANDYYVKAQHPVREVIDKIKEVLSKNES